jgi:uncharacterized membrane protein YhiD involved in acid resistance
VKEYLLANLAAQGALGYEQLLLNAGVTLVLGILIYAIYAWTYAGITYSKKFNISLIMLALVTNMVMTVISNNIALSLGMVGALSIVRFRTAIKDARDTTFIFWSIAVGICCGVGFYLAAAIGSASVIVFLLTFHHIRDDNKYILVVRSDTTNPGLAEVVVQDYYRKPVLRVKNTTLNDVEFIYEISGKDMKASSNKNKNNIMELLYRVSGVKMVNLVAQADDMSR